MPHLWGMRFLAISMESVPVGSTQNIQLLTDPAFAHARTGIAGNHAWDSCLILTTAAWIRRKKLLENSAGNWE